MSNLSVAPILSTHSRERTSSWKFKRLIPLYIMLIPAALGLVFFNYLPMGGLVMVFQNYKPLLGFGKSHFVGLANFQRLLALPDFWPLIRNTLFIACGKMILGQLVALAFALLLHEVRHRMYKRTVQTITYATYFLSWILLGGVLLDVLGSDGIVNTIFGVVGAKPMNFLIDPQVFPWTLIITDVWKGFGMGAVLYLAALAEVDRNLYEAAAVDGAGRMARMWNITLPGIAPTITILACLGLGSVLDAGMDQVLVLYNPAVYSTGDVIGTWVYRVGLTTAQYSLGATVGLLQSVVGFLMVAGSYYLAHRLADYRIF